MYLTVTLDLFIMRSFFRIFRKAPFIGKECEGMVYVVDEWAGKFVDELDYLRELENTERFRNLMLQAGDAVMVPQVDFFRSQHTFSTQPINTPSQPSLSLPSTPFLSLSQPYPKLSSELLTVSQWVDGTKLSKIDKTTPQVTHLLLSAIVFPCILYIYYRLCTLIHPNLQLPFAIFSQTHFFVLSFSSGCGHCP